MTRRTRFAPLLIALVIGATIAPTVASAADDATRLRWYGQSYFQLVTTKGTRIVFDPHAIELFGRPRVEADLALLSHQHNDHTQTGEIANPGKFKIIQGLAGTGRQVTWKKVNETFRDAKIRSVPSYHDQSEGMERGKNTIFVVTVDDLTFCHLGDLGHELTPELVKEIGPVDVLMIPVGGIYTLNGSEASTVVEQLKPRLYTVPMHCGTPVYDDLLPPDEFLDGRKDVERLKGNELVIPADPKPVGPMKVVLPIWPKN
jgi:L-ascorbate metabolism protein UlaG (beta-lactamase superfamily)